MRTFIILLGIIILLLPGLSACRPAPPVPTATPNQPAHTTALSRTLPPSATLPPTHAPTSTVSLTPTITFTPSITPTSSITPTPAFDLPDVVVNKQAHCRYGPSIAYLHAADLYAGDRGVVWGRFAFSQWLQIKFDKLTYPCWVAPSVIDVSGDISRIYYTQPDLLKIGSNIYGPPQKVEATRNGDQVTITWKRVSMTEDDDYGYFIEAWVCQDGVYKWWTASLPDQYATSYTVQDEPGCKHPSGGEIRTVEKHGYSEPATIPWP